MNSVTHAELIKRPHRSNDRPFLPSSIGSENRGQPLSSEVRTLLEPRIGHSFEGVRVHADDQADGVAQAIGAKAFTTDQDIFFREGKYDPCSREGMHLLAHELMHTVQQSNAPVINDRPAIGDRSDQFEDAANAVADAALADSGGEPLRMNVQAAVVADGGVPAIQCEEEDSGLGFLGTLLSGVAGFGRVAINDVAPAFPPGGIGPLTLEGAQAHSAVGGLNVVGGGINVAKGIHGLLEAEDAGDVIAPVLSSIGGGMQLLGGAAAAGGMQGGVAALGPLGAAVALGGTLGSLAGEAAWDWHKGVLGGGTRTEDATDLGSDFVPGEAYNPERSWLFDLLEGD
jgi:hypothetical protein